MAKRSQPTGLVVGAALLAVLASAALAAPWLAPDVSAMNLEASLTPPSPLHWLGTDNLGRDLLARLLHGARVSLAVGLLASALALFVGAPLGAAAGFRGGALDGFISRLMEAVYCFPALLLALALLAAAPASLLALPEPVRIAVVLGLTGWVPAGRYLRAEVLRLRRTEMIAAARATGASDWRIVVRHILPGAVAPALVTAAFLVGSAIAIEGALSFLGLGVNPTTPSWGGMLAEAREQLHRAWWLALPPGAAIFVTVFACNLVGEGIRDRLDPRTAERRG